MCITLEYLRVKEGNPRHEVQKLISFFLINRSFRGLSTYTVIINNQLQRKQKQYSNECAIFCTEEKEKKFWQQIPSNMYCTFFCDTCFPFWPLCLRWTLMFNTKKKLLSPKTTYSVSLLGKGKWFDLFCCSVGMTAKGIQKVELT